MLQLIQFLKRQKKNKNNLPYDVGTYDNPIARSNLEQFECIYVKDKSNYDIKDLSVLIGYGLSQEVKKIFDKSNVICSKFEKDEINKILKNFF